MSEQVYYLMHKDDVAAMVTIDDVTGAMLRVAPQLQPEQSKKLRHAVSPTLLRNTL